MENNITDNLILLACLLLPIVASADTVTSESMQMACSRGSSGENNHLQYAEEGWFTGNRRSVNEYRERIQQIESDDGVFSYKLIPELIGLGLLGQEQSNSAESAEVFERALYVIRAHDGLYSTRQFPLLDLMIESNSTLQEWKRVAKSYDMMYWLYKRNFAKNDPAQLQTLKRLRRWYMESYNKDAGRSLEELFKNSEKLYEQAVRIMWECTSGDERQTLCFWHKACCTDPGVIQGYCPLDRG